MTLISTSLANVTRQTYQRQHLPFSVEFWAQRHFLIKSHSPKVVSWRFYDCTLDAQRATTEGRRCWTEVTWICRGRLALTVYSSILVGFSLHISTSSRSMSPLISRPLATRPTRVTPHSIGMLSVLRAEGRQPASEPLTDTNINPESTSLRSHCSEHASFFLILFRLIIPCGNCADPNFRLLCITSSWGGFDLICQSLNFNKKKNNKNKQSHSLVSLQSPSFLLLWLKTLPFIVTSSHLGLSPTLHWLTKKILYSSVTIQSVVAAYRCSKDFCAASCGCLSRKKTENSP